MKSINRVVTSIFDGRFTMKYDYDDLLKRGCAQIPEVSLKRERLELPMLFVNTVGMRTIINNFKDVAAALDRDPQHILKFLTREMATAATYHEGRAIFQGKFGRDSFARLLQRYTESFVTCPVCKRPDTKIVKEKRLTFLICNACGARSSIKQL
ncbi:MAG TPA: translation initiation factor IF-2 subunit beta [Candidatus Sulfotelmatobacter sp.]|nr:translation initiation factor IF-2 subunit beta [Candidatus Sulfotelmatobacter sp.]